MCWSVWSKKVKKRSMHYIFALVGYLKVLIVFCQKSTFSWYIFSWSYRRSLDFPRDGLCCKGHSLYPVDGWYYIITRVFGHPKAYTGGLLFLMFQSHLIFCDFLMVMRSIFICSGKWVIKLQKFTDFTFFTFLAAWPRFERSGDRMHRVSVLLYKNLHQMVIF